MSPETQVKIQETAYKIWEAEGRPEGDDLAHWLQAEAVIKAGTPKTKASPQSTKKSA